MGINNFINNWIKTLEQGYIAWTKTINREKINPISFILKALKSL